MAQVPRTVWVFAIALAWLLWGAADAAIVRDEGEYFKASAAIADWLRLLLAGGFGEALSASGVDAHWSFNHEHPPLAKAASALGVLVAGTGSPLAYRIGSLVVGALGLAVAHRAMERRYGAWVSALAVAAILGMPHVVGHARIVGMDFLVALWLLVAALYFRDGFRSPRRALVFGVFLGLAMATKINAWLAPAPLVLWAFIYRRKESAPVLFALLGVAPVVCVALWPWMWRDTASRLLEFWSFHLSHVVYPVYYLRNVYGEGGVDLAAPWHYAPTLFAVTMPVAILAVGAFGAYRMIRSSSDRADGVFWGLQVLFPMALLSLPDVPVYNGVRLFLGSLLAWAVFFGVGAAAICDAVGRAWSGPVAPRLAAAVLTVGGLWAVARGGPYQAYGYYGAAIGGRSGALQAGLETNNWGAVGTEVIDYLNDNLAPGDVIYDGMGATHPLMTYQLVLGQLRSDVHFGNPATWIVFEVNQGWSTWYRWWDLYHDRDRQFRLVRRFEHDGAPHVLVFRLRDELIERGERPVI